MRDLVWGSKLITRVYIPRTLFAVAAVGTGAVNLGFALVPLGFVVLLSGITFNLSLLFLPVAILLAAMFTLGVGLGLSTLAVFFTDIVDMYQILLLAWMYLTPIIYPIEILAPEFRWVIEINPMYYIIECFRMPIYLGTFPTHTIVIRAGISALVALFVGSLIFSRKSNEFTYYL